MIGFHQFGYVQPVRMNKYQDILTTSVNGIDTNHTNETAIQPTLNRATHELNAINLTAKKSMELMAVLRHSTKSLISDDTPCLSSLTQICAI